MRVIKPWIDSPILAYHVAAHAVLQLQLGRELEFASADPLAARDDCTVGQMESYDFAEFRSTDARAALERDCLYQIAGKAVEVQILRPYSHRGTHLAERDVEVVSDLLSPLDTTEQVKNATIRYLAQTAWAVLGDSDVFYRVKRVAEALSRRDYLTEREIWRAIDEADSLIPVHRRLRKRRLTGRRIADLTSPVLQPSHNGLEDTPKATVAVLPPRLVQQPLMRSPPEKPPVLTAGGTTLEALGLSGLALNTLQRRGGIHTVEQLLVCTVEDISSIRWFGAKTRAEVREALRSAGHKPGW